MQNITFSSSHEENLLPTGRKWWKEAIIYQIYPQSFCDSNSDGIGDLRGIISKLDYLVNLGVNALWISPIYPGPGYDNGYDISDYEGIDPKYGTMADFECLLKEAHSRDLKVIMDLVVNHSSVEHPWFKESRSSLNNNKRDYYIWRNGKNGGPPNNWGSLFGGPAWTYDETTGQYYLHLFSAHQPDLNWENPVLRREIYAMMRRWLDRGVDGFRMDVISLISKPQDFPNGPTDANGYGNSRVYVANSPRVHEFIQEMRNEALAGYDAVAIGEASGVTLDEAKKYAAEDGRELDMVFQFEHMDLDGGETFKWDDRKIQLPELKRVLDKWQTGMAGKGWNTLYWCNHDQPRIVSRLGDEGMLRERSATMLATCLYMMQGTPFIYQGEELGMTNMLFTSPEQLRDPESRTAYQEYTSNGTFAPELMMKYICGKNRDNARTPMQWNNNQYAGFSDILPWMDVNPNCS